MVFVEKALDVRSQQFSFVAQMKLGGNGCGVPLVWRLGFYNDPFILQRGEGCPSSIGSVLTQTKNGSFPDISFGGSIPGSFPNIFVSEIASKWRFYQHFSQWSMAREEKNPISWESNSPVTFSVENKPIIRGPQVPFVQKRQLVGNGFQAWFLWRQCVQ